MTNSSRHFPNPCDCDSNPPQIKPVIPFNRAIGNHGCVRLGRHGWPGLGLPVRCTERSGPVAAYRRRWLQVHHVRRMANTAGLRRELTARRTGMTGKCLSAEVS